MFIAKRSHFCKFATHFLIAFAIFGSIGASDAHAQASWPTARDSGHLTGSWLTTYQIAVFGGNTPILLSFTGDGILIETDTPIPTPFGGSIRTVVLSNGHGAWKQTGERAFAFTYKKEIFHTDGSSYGVAQTNGTATVSSDGAHLEIALTLLTVTDNEGNVAFSTTGTGTAARIVVDEKN